MGVHKKYSEEDIHEMGKDLVATIDSDECWHLVYWPVVIKDKTDTWMYNLAVDYPLFGEYLDKARRKLGCKYAKQGMTDRANPWMLRRYMPKWLGDQQWVREEMAKDTEAEAEAKAKAVGKHLDMQADKADDLISKIDSYAEKQTRG